MPTRFFPFTLSPEMLAASDIVRPRRGTPLPTDTTSIDQQLADSFNSNNAVLAYVVAITGTTMPVLTPQPDWYQAFLTQFASAKTHALEWQNSITPGLISIPVSILNYAPIWSMNSGAINQAIAILQQAPNNQQAQQVVRDCLTTLLAGTRAQQKAAVSFQQLIDQFATNLTADAENMAVAIHDAVNQQGVDQQQIAQLMADIDELNKQIATWQTVETAASIGAGVAFFAGAVIAIFSFGAGLAFGIVGAAAGIATAIAASFEIKKLSLKIAQDQGEMDLLNQQVATLSIIEKNLATLIDLSRGASQQVQLIQQAWGTLEQEISAVVTDLDNAQGDLTSMNLSELAVDMTDANNDWATLQQFCSVVAGIQYNLATPPSVTLPTDGNTAHAARSALAGRRR